MARILLTGAAGDIGTRLRKILKPVYPDLRLSDIKKPADLRPDEEFVAADLARIGGGREDRGRHRRASSTWAASPSKGPGRRSCSPTSSAATICSRRRGSKGVKRVVFASSNHAVGFYPRHHHIGIDVTVRPDSRYGVSKAFGEALGSLYADKHGLRVLCLRIGNVGDKPLDKRRLSIWVSAGGPRAADAHRPRASRPALRDLLRRLLERARLVGQPHGLRLRLSPDGARRGLSRARAWPSRPS